MELEQRRASDRAKIPKFEQRHFPCGASVFHKRHDGGGVGAGGACVAAHARAAIHFGFDWRSESWPGALRCAGWVRDLERLATRALAAARAKMTTKCWDNCGRRTPSAALR